MCLLTLVTYGQKSEIDTYCFSLDSKINTNRSIVCQTFSKKTDFDSARIFDRLYIDTSENKLVKSVYQFEFFGVIELLEIYYHEGQVVKIYAENNLNNHHFTGIFYFRDGKFAEQTGGEISPGKPVFDLEQILISVDGHKKMAAGFLK
jgi:hypothetical protein